MDGLILFYTICKMYGMIAVHNQCLKCVPVYQCCPLYCRLVTTARDVTAAPFPLVIRTVISAQLTATARAGLSWRGATQWRPALYTTAPVQGGGG